MTAVESDVDLSQYTPNTFTRLLRYLGLAETHTPLDGFTKLADRFDWLLVFANLGNANFNSLQIGFEDYLTGEITCQSAELMLEPCTEVIIEP